MLWHMARGFVHGIKGMSTLSVPVCVVHVFRMTALHVHACQSALISFCACHCGSKLRCRQTLSGSWALCAATFVLLGAYRGAGIALDIAKGLHFLHSHHVMHLDLKSPNILLAQDGTAKIADVGLSRIFTTCSLPVAKVSQHFFSLMFWVD